MTSQCWGCMGAIEHALTKIIEPVPTVGYCPIGGLARNVDGLIKRSKHQMTSRARFPEIML